MRRNENYLLRTVAGSIVVVPVGRAALDFNGMLTVNETTAMLWDLLETEQTEESLTDALCLRFDVTRERAAADIALWIQKLRVAGALDQP